nr:MAG TPA: hypothetical protein [Caudoviricetes sp.]
MKKPAARCSLATGFSYGLFHGGQKCPPYEFCSKMSKTINYPFLRMLA